MVNILVLDLETTVEIIEGRIDNSPKNPRNRCVMAQYGWLGDETVDVVHIDTFYHEECTQPSDITRLTQHLAEADVLVIHNGKFDGEWLLEMGFELPKLIYCTLIAEYCLAKGRGHMLGLGLKATAERRKTPSRKLSELVDDLFKSGVGFEKIPLKDVIEYGIADVKTCGEIYLDQQRDLAKGYNLSLKEVILFMNEMLVFLIEIEMNGIKIDLEKLEKVEGEFRAEQVELTQWLHSTLEKVMGDTPINLNSGADTSMAIYSRTVVDKPMHISVFNIGVDDEGNKKHSPRYSKRDFASLVHQTTAIARKTTAICCPDCKGVGSTQKYKVKTKQKNGKKYRVQGEPYQQRTGCKTCNKKGAIYQPTTEIAGFKMVPLNASYASANGFKTDKATILLLIEHAKAKGKHLAVEFLTKISRLKAISTYLDSFCAGIKRGTRETGLLHANFNQCTAATGRLSSGGGISLNLQNMPKRGFPVRECVVSRFGKDHLIVDADYSSLEFRTAVQLSNDSQGKEDIARGKDIHRQTASICLQKDPSEITKEERSSHKWASFQPLFGGRGMGQPDHIREYFDSFYRIYDGIYQWHNELMEGTLRDGIVQTPSGRQYYWPDVQRTKSNRVTKATQILNYPVQGFSADLVQLACIRALRMFKEEKLKSKLIITVHDSLTVDCFAPELEKVKHILTESMTNVGEEAEKRFGYRVSVPFDIEISGGKNWLEQVEYG